MSEDQIPNPFQERIDLLSQALTDIRRKMEGLMAENQRMREMTRLAEGELRKRHTQTTQMGGEITTLHQQRLEVKGRVENVMEHIERLTALTKKANG